MVNGFLIGRQRQNLVQVPRGNATTSYTDSTEQHRENQTGRNGNDKEQPLYFELQFRAQGVYQDLQDISNSPDHEYQNADHRQRGKQEHVAYEDVTHVRIFVTVMSLCIFHVYKFYKYFTTLMGFALPESFVSV